MQAKFIGMSNTLMETPAPAKVPPAPKSYSLSPEEVRCFHDEGYLGPYAAVTPEEMERIRHHLDTVAFYIQ